MSERKRKRQRIEYVPGSILNDPPILKTGQKRPREEEEEPETSSAGAKRGRVAEDKKKHPNKGGDTNSLKQELLGKKRFPKGLVAETERKAKETAPSTEAAETFTSSFVTSMIEEEEEEEEGVEVEE
ncbi:hypothetical protein G6F37_004683 [Rhizopus arrhizus]|nr:hypothetical protein G6F38_011332 [Rhizopus arrhizus]KAG1159673.1 hypothetical protein G6F37_004683 [Rhizopus arrhizus]